MNHKASAFAFGRTGRTKGVPRGWGAGGSRPGPLFDGATEEACVGDAARIWAGFGGLARRRRGSGGGLGRKSGFGRVFCRRGADPVRRPRSLPFPADPLPQEQAPRALPNARQKIAIACRRQNRGSRLLTAVRTSYHDAPRTKVRFALILYLNLICISPPVCFNRTGKKGKRLYPAPPVRLLSFDEYAYNVVEVLS
jgi:hypothetical protein